MQRFIVVYKETGLLKELQKDEIEFKVDDTVLNDIIDDIDTFPVF